MNFYFVIPFYKNKSALNECLLSILDQGVHPEHIIVVNNGKINLNDFKKNLGPLRILTPEHNLGYGGGINCGVKNIFPHLKSDDILVFLNDDIILSPGWLEELKNTLKRFPDFHIIGGKILFREHPQIIYNAGDFPHISGFGVARGMGQIDKGQYESAEEVFGITGAAMAVKFGLFKKLNGFDERFFMYLEDLDFCARARKKGARCFYNPKMISYHYGALSSGLYSKFFIYWNVRNSLIFIKKHFPTEFVRTHKAHIKKARIKTLKEYFFGGNWQAVLKGTFEGLKEAAKTKKEALPEIVKWIQIAYTL